MAQKCACDCGRDRKFELTSKTNVRIIRCRKG